MVFLVLTHNFTMKGLLSRFVFLFLEIKKWPKILIFATVWHFWGFKALLKSKYYDIKPLLNVTFNFELIGTVFSLIGIILFEVQ